MSDSSYAARVMDDDGELDPLADLHAAAEEEVAPRRRDQRRGLALCPLCQHCTRLPCRSMPGPKLLRRGTALLFSRQHAPAGPSRPAQPPEEDDEEDGAKRTKKKKKNFNALEALAKKQQEERRVQEEERARVVRTRRKKHSRCLVLAHSAPGGSESQFCVCYVS